VECGIGNAGGGKIDRARGSLWGRGEAKCRIHSYLTNMYSLFRIHIIFNTGSIFLMRAKVADRGQVTIPKILRERLGIRPGTVLEFKEDQGKLIAVKATAIDTIDQFYGKLGSGRRTDDVMRELRGNS